MKYFFLLLIYLLPVTLPAQFSQEFQQLMMEGIQKHEQGDFEGAIGRYEQALDINEHFMVYYEMAYSYHALDEYDKAMDLLETSMEMNDSQENVGAYILYGGILDDQGDTEEAIEFYEDAIEDIDFYLLDYNLAVSYFRNQQIEKGLERFKTNILKNKAHSSPHHDLSLFYYESGQPTRSLLSGCYFLLTEPPTSHRNIMISDMLMDILKLNTKKVDNVTMINTNRNEEIFGGSDIMINMVNLSTKSLDKTLEGYEDISDTTDRGKFKRRLKFTFQVILEANYSEKDDELWIDFYLDFYRKIMDEDLYDTAFNLITFNKYIESSKWVKDNPEKVKKFAAFMKDVVLDED